MFSIMWNSGLILCLLHVLEIAKCGIHRTVECKKPVCSSTKDCHISKSPVYTSGRVSSYDYCVDDKKFVGCHTCRLKEESFSLEVQVTGIRNHRQLLGYSEALLIAVSKWCPSINCNALHFKPWTQTSVASTMNFLSFEGEWDIATTTLIADNFRTKLYFIKHYRGEAIAAVDPIDIARLLSHSSVIRLLQGYGLTVQVRDKNFQKYIRKELGMETSSSSKGGSDTEAPLDTSTKTQPDSINPRIMVLILFGVLLFTVFLSIALFRTRPSCLRRIYHLERSSSTQHVVTENANVANETTPTTPNATTNETLSSSSDEQPAIDGFLQPPPYTEEDKYKKDNPPPSYADVFTVEVEHRGEEETITITTTSH